jgi:glycerol kinase
MSDLILAIDQGTHSTRAIVFDSQGCVVTSARQSIGLQRLGRTEIEQSATEILQSMQSVVASVLDDPAINPEQITSAGMATQRSSIVAWDRNTGVSLSPVLSWQDRRAADRLHSLSDQSQTIQQLTGLPLSPHYGASKLQWLLENNTAVAAALEDNTLVMGPLASYLLHHLTDYAHEAIDDANASRTLLWNLEHRNWDNTLLEMFHIPLQVLPQCKPICSDYGTLKGFTIPVCAMNGDQTAALYAQGLPSNNTITVNIGTGAFVLLPVETPSTKPDGLLAGISYSDEQTGSYYIEGTVNGAAAALKWAENLFELEGIEQQLPVWLDEIQTPTLFINSVGGLGAPWWQQGPTPRFLDAGVSGPEAMVAVIESIIFLIQVNVALLQTVNPAVDRIQISGGLSQLDKLCQKLANLSGLAVYRPVQIEATARGIAWQAAGCPTVWPATGEGTTFTPMADPGLKERYIRLVEILHTL